ncbi:hypothetical protein J4477_00315 [Candidatus Pacearchaeota archaeon]|nr:hypothetical protein [Candidatus Pacearchaeota archaeon]
MPEVNYSNEILTTLQYKFNLNENQLKNYLQQIINDLNKPFIPISIFSHKLTPLESIVKYLKEEQNLTFHEISKLLKRNEKNLWHTYYNAKKKNPSKFKVYNTDLQISLDIFSNKIPPMKTIVKYLREQKSLSYHDIGLLLKKNERTIWTSYNRK